MTLALVAALGALRQQIGVLDQHITDQFTAHPDAAVFTSLPGSGTVRAARLLAEIGDARGRFPTPEALTCLPLDTGLLMPHCVRDAPLPGVEPSTRDVDASRRGSCGRMTVVVGLRSRVGLGTAPLGSRIEGPLWWGPQDPDDAVGAVRAALDAGVDWIDTAPFYGWGRAEELVGRAVAGSRDEVRILTKCGTVRRADGRAAEDASPAAVRAGLHESLRRLGTDYVDVLQVHDPDPATPVDETWAAITDLVMEGLVRAGGLSNHPVELMARAHAVAPVAVVQHQYSLLHRAPETDGVLDWCAEHGSAFLAWAPLASGFLTEGFDLSGLAPDDLRHRLPWARRDLAALRRRLDTVAARHGVPAHRVALAWATRRPGTYAIVGARTPTEAADLNPLPDLTAADIADLEQ